MFKATVAATHRTRREAGAKRASCSLLVVALLSALAATASPPAIGQVSDPTANDWPKFHHGPQNAGVSPDTAISSASAPSLGIDWEANTGAAAFGSPAVAWNTQLKRELVYVGNSNGTMSAYDAVTGARVWVYKAPLGIHSSPA